jgi:sulfate permease, SulP family
MMKMLFLIVAVFVTMAWFISSETKSQDQQTEQRQLTSNQMLMRDKLVQMNQVLEGITLRTASRMPGPIVALVTLTVVATVMQLPVETIGSRFGGIPQMLPMPHLPALSLEKVVAVLPAALSFALLGGIESLLSAVVADSMSGRRHRSNAELVAQGTANIASSLFGGFCVTGTIARTAANVRAGARGPVAGMLHALFLLAFMLIAAPLARFIPLSALAAILVVVAWNMAEKHQFAALLRSSKGDAVVLLVTFLLVVFRDLIEGIVVGFSLGALLFLHRMSKEIEVDHAHPVVEADDAPNGEKPYSAALRTDEDVVVYRISGAFFFGAAATVGSALDRIGGQPKAFVIDISAVDVLDSTAAATIEGFARKAGRQGAKIYLVGATTPMRHLLHKHGLHAPQIRFYRRLDAAVAAARRMKQ